MWHYVRQLHVQLRAAATVHSYGTNTITFFGLKDNYVGVRKSQDPWARPT